MSMRWLLAGLGALLAGPVLAQGESAAQLAKKSKEILATYCHRCHGENGAIEGGVNYLLDRQKLVTRKKIVPGSPAKSHLLSRILLEEMPPEGEKARPSAADVNVLKQWIAQGAPDFNPQPKRPFISNAQILELVWNDLNGQSARDQKFLRYFSLVHLYNAGFSEDELETYRQAQAKLINSLSWSAKIAPPRAIDAERTLFRIDLRDYKWTAKNWDQVRAQYPYGVISGQVLEKRSQIATETEVPIVRADWFVASASQPPLYHELLQMPESDQLLERELRVNVTENLRSRQAARAGFNGSGVSRNNRLVERHDSFFGAYWKSYDFSSSAGLQNLFNTPLGPANFRNRFMHEGGEIIFNLPNGLQAYMLVDGRGQRIDKGPLTVVSDPRRPDRTVVNGLSCMSCHAQGIIAKDDQIRAHVEKNKTAFSAGDFDQVMDLYVPKEKMQALMKADADRFKQAVEKAGCRTGGTEPVATLAVRFEAEVELPLAAAELGQESATLMNKIRKSLTLTKSLGPLLVEGGTVQRDHFTTAFPLLCKELDLGRVLPRLATEVRPWRPAEPFVPVPIEPTPVATQFKVFPPTRMPDHTVFPVSRRDGNQFTALACSPQERVLALETSLGKVVFWDPKTGIPSHMIHAHGRSPSGGSLISQIAYSPDGMKLATCSPFDDEGNVKVFSVASGKMLTRFTGLPSGARGIAFSPNGKALAVLTKRIHLFDLEADKETVSFPNFEQKVTMLCFSRDGKEIISAGSELRFWDVGTGKENGDPVPLQKELRTAVVSPDGKVLAIGSDSAIQLWDLHTRKVHRTLRGHKLPVLDLAFTPDGKKLVSSAGTVERVMLSPAEVKVWDLEQGKEAFDLVGHTRAAYRVLVTHDGRSAITLGTDSTLRVWDITPERKPETFFVTHTGTINGLVISVDGAWGVTSSDERLIIIWDPATSKEIKRIPCLHQPGRLALTADKKFIYCLFGDGKLRKIDSATGGEAGVWPVKDASVFAGFALSPDEKVLALGTGVGAVKIFDVEKQALRNSFQGHLGPVNHLAFSPDSRMLAASGGNKMIRVWDLEKGTHSQDLRQHSNYISALAYTPDGKQLLAADQNLKMNLYDPYTAEVVRSFDSRTAHIFAMAISQDGTKVFTGGSDTGHVKGKPVPANAIILWDFATGKQLRSWTNPTKSVQHVALTPDGNTAFVVSGSHLRRLDLRVSGARQPAAVQKGKQP